MLTVPRTHNECKRSSRDTGVGESNFVRAQIRTFSHRLYDHAVAKLDVSAEIFAALASIFSVTGQRDRDRFAFSGRHDDAALI